MNSNAHNMFAKCARVRAMENRTVFLFISAESEPYSGVIRYNEKVFVKNASYKITLKPPLE